MFKLEKGNPNNLEGIVNIYMENPLDENPKYLSLKIEYNPDASSSFPGMMMANGLQAPEELKELVDQLKYLHTKFDITPGAFSNKIDLEIQTGDIMYLGKHPAALAPLILTGRSVEYMSTYLEQQKHLKKTIHEEPAIQYNFNELIAKINHTFGEYFRGQFFNSEEMKQESKAQLYQLCKDNKMIKTQIDSIFVNVKNHPKEYSRLIKKGVELIIAVEEQDYEEAAKIRDKIKQIKEGKQNDRS